MKTGDVLLNIVGASIGRVALATPDVEGGNVNQAVAVIRLNQERMLPKYLMLNLLSPGTELGSKKWTPSTYYRGLEVWDGTVTATAVYKGVP